MRPPREIHPGIVYHLIARCVNRDWLIRDDEDRETYLRLLGHAMSKSDWSCLAYAIMSSHIHLAMLAGQQALSAWLGYLHSPFVGVMNKKYSRLGPFFARGPRDYAILPQNEGKLIAYVHRNPVRARVVRRAADSTWTSHRAYAGLVVPPKWLHVDQGRARSGLVNPTDFDAWVDATPGDGGYVKLEEVRRQARRRGAIEVATPTGGETPMIPLVARPWAHIRHDPRRIVEVVVETVGLPVELVCSARRSVEVIAARKVAVDAAIRLGVTAADIASALGITGAGALKIHRRSMGTDEREACDVVLQRLRFETAVPGHRRAG